MTKRMLIDATHAEETRVVVLNGNRLDEFDFETSTKKQLKGNIYLAKVTRVEPSLQAAFVEFGGNRHGFLAFSEIHPDYYQIPVADRVALLREQEEAYAAENDEDEDDTAEERGQAPAEAHDDVPEDDAAEAASETAEQPAGDAASEAPEADAGDEAAAGEDEAAAADGAPAGETAAEDGEAPAEPVSGGITEVAAPHPVEELGGADDAEEHHAERRRVRPRRQRYKIQEVIKRRQILLVQVVKEERGNKGAALTTYLSLAGRYCVLMPNTAKGGGISRKITSAGDRKRLKSLISDLEIPDGMAVILRTAAVERSKAELKRDFEFLMRSWDLVRERTLQSIAPTLVYEEANLIKRSIRDLYTKDIDEVQVEGDEGYKTAKEFMRMLMPSHAKKVQPYKDPEIPLFHRYQVEAQLDAMHSPHVSLKSGGYIVINPTEALVSIDVNSGRATRERNIEETAHKTNLEASDEIARQLRLRDLAGLIVIDFIDMGEHRNQHSVERRLKDAMRNDRARIQIGRISAFGLLELSRQRLRPSLIEASTTTCPYCHGTGLIRSTESAALHVLRAIEEEGIRHRSTELRIAVAVNVALYILNQKRDMLHAIERRYGFRVLISGDDSLIPPDYNLERIEGKPAVEARPEAALPAPVEEAAEAEENAAEDSAPEDEGETATAAGEGEDDGEERGGRRRRRRRRRPHRDDEAQDGARPQAAAPAQTVEDDEDSQADGEEAGAEETAEAAGDGAEKPKRRRRGRRGGRRRGRNRERQDGEAEGPEMQAEPSTGEENAPPAEDAEPEDATPLAEEEPVAAHHAEPQPSHHPEHVNGNGDAGVAVEAPEQPVPMEAEVAAKGEGPRRKGWWNRFGG